MTEEPPPGRAFRIFKGCWTAAYILAVIIGGGGLLAINLWFHVFHRVDDQAPMPTASAMPAATTNPVAQPPVVDLPRQIPTYPDPFASRQAVTTVNAYCFAIFGGQLHHAWADLGGRNMIPSWPKFQAGYADTGAMICSITSVDGDKVSFHIEAQHLDGSWHDYDAVYTVDNGVITAGTMALVSTDPPLMPSPSAS